MLGAGYQTTELLFAGLNSPPVYALAITKSPAGIYPLNLWTARCSGAADLSFLLQHRRLASGALVMGRARPHHSSPRMNFLHGNASECDNIFNGAGLFYVPVGR